MGAALEEEKKKSFLRPVLAFVPPPSMNFLGPLPPLTMPLGCVFFFLFYPLLFFFVLLCTWAGGCRTPQHARTQQAGPGGRSAVGGVVWLEPGG